MSPHSPTPKALKEFSRNNILRNITIHKLSAQYDSETELYYRTSCVTACFKQESRWHEVTNTRFMLHTHTCYGFIYNEKKI